MDRRRILRWFRIAATAAILSASALMASLWLRNFWRADVVWAPLPGHGQLVIASLQGQMELAVYLSVSASSPLWGAKDYSVTWNHLSEVLFPRTVPLRFRRLRNSQGVNLSAPYWFLVPVSWVFAAAPWIRWSTRFSLRAMLIATTLVAVALGIYVRSGW